MSAPPKKGDFIINPSTARPVKVGSRTWLNLVRAGLINGHYSDPKELATIEPDENVEQKIKEVNKSLPRNIQAVRGRGKYKDKIVSRTKTPSAAEIARYNAQIGGTAMDSNSIDNNEDDDEELMFETILENMMKNDQSSTMETPKNKPPRNNLAMRTTSRAIKPTLRVGRPSKKIPQSSSSEYDTQDNYDDQNSSDTQYDYL